MKFLRLMLFLALALNGWMVQAKCSEFAADDIGVKRYTDLGGDEARQDSGRLFVKQGFVPLNSRVINKTIDSYNITPDVMAQINGQTIMPLSSWIALDVPQPGGGTTYCNFSKSAATYSVENVPYVIVTVTPGGSGGGFVKNPKVSISAVTPTCTETAGAPCQFMITLSGPTRKTTRVRFTVDGKATRNKDYIRFPNSVAIPSGNVSAIVEVIPIDDNQREGNENVRVKLLPSPAYKLRRASANVQIIDND
ncbi:hypothetical protein MCAMS1_00889 [biofilm metagenome]